VISWILPQTERTRLDNSRETALPAERWSFSRKYGEDFNVKLRHYVVRSLGDKGCEAVAPMTSPGWKWEKSDRYGFASSWSERHAAHASGLGTFGLCDGLITPRGKAMRCGKCIKRCPVDAISREGGHDKGKCHDYLRNVTEKYIETRYGFKTSPCGLCQTGVPCEAGNPVPGRRD